MRRAIFPIVVMGGIGICAPAHAADLKSIDCVVHEMAPAQFDLLGKALAEGWQNGRADAPT